MRKAKRWRYYCDHCGKSGGHAGYMKTHEEHCTSNPNRRCRVCGYDPDYPHVELKELVRIAREAFYTEKAKQSAEDMWWKLFDIMQDEDNPVLTELRKHTRCPACLLATSIQVGKEPDYITFGFNYQKEREVFWRDYAEQEVT